MSMDIARKEITNGKAAKKLKKTKIHKKHGDAPQEILGHKDSKKAKHTETSVSDSDSKRDSVALSTSPAPKPEKKRKRKAKQDADLEINVNLPEPPSKKAIRKAKKRKVVETVSQNSEADEKHLVGQQSAQDLEPEAYTPLDGPVKTKETPHDQVTSKHVPKHSIWIGNIVFTITKPMLRDFFTAKSGSAITEQNITRIHLPPPQNARATKTKLKPQNRGFAYVDFSSETALKAALALSESVLGGRNVLIKDAKDFEGRPEKSNDAAASGLDGKSDSRGKPSRRVFVGNLGFDVNVEDIRSHYDKCGVVEDVKLATFEDSGKCKGFGWVVFDEVEAAGAAVRGWVRLPERDESDGGQADEDDGGERGITIEANSRTVKKNKKTTGRTWFVNRLQGRLVRCEFAEDASLRYKKRFGKGGAQKSQEDTTSPERDAAVAVDEEAKDEGMQEDLSWGAKTKRRNNFTIKPGAPTDRSQRRGRNRQAAKAG